MEEYLRRNENFSTEDVLRAFYLLEDLVASPFSGWLLSSIENAAGSPAAEIRSIVANYDWDGAEEIAKRAAGISRERTWSSPL